MKPSKKQQAIYDLWETTDHNILIQAVAGSGKTSTLMELMKMCSPTDKIHYIAFNKSIKEETQIKINELGLMGRAQTLHALGFEAIKKIHPKVKLDDYNKKWDIIKELERRLPDEFNIKLRPFKNYEDVMKLKFCLIDMNEVSRTNLIEDKETIFELMINMDKNVYDPDFIDIDLLWSELLNIREEFYSRVPLVIDFNDMIFLPARGDYYIPAQADILMLDECQDFNICQHKLIDNYINQGDIKKWVGAGDPNQGIYGFSGAHAESFNLFKEKDNVVEMPLDICYRCSSSIVESANEVYNVMEAFKTKKGIVRSIVNPSHLAKNPNAMVVCRNKLPLVELYFMLLEKEIPSKLVGNDIKDSLIRFLSSYKKYSINRALEDIDDEIYKLSRDLNSEQKKIKHYILNENRNYFVLLYSKLGISSSSLVPVLIEAFKKLFEGSEDIISLCTIHKSKGLEANVVYILNENLIPSKFARSEQQLIQEQNLKYVARTRAKEEMYFLNIDFKQNK